MPALRRWADQPEVFKAAPVQRLCAACRAHLDARIASALAPAGDWRRDSALPCRCQHCNELARFLGSADQRTWRFKAAELVRAHVLSSIRAVGSDVDSVTDKTAEWEAAACGSAARHWPWAQPQDPGPWQINADPAHLRRTTPVAAFPASDTPDGLVDLSGNVWQWTSSRYTPSLEATALTTPAPDGTAPRALRGGSWDDPAARCRPDYRSRSA